MTKAEIEAVAAQVQASKERTAKILVETAKAVLRAGREANVSEARRGAPNIKRTQTSVRGDDGALHPDEVLPASVAEAIGGDDVQRISPTRCRTYVRRRVAKNITGLVTMMLDRAEQGSYNHLRAMLLWSGLYSDRVRPAARKKNAKGVEGPNLATLLLEEMERRRTAAGEGEKEGREREETAVPQTVPHPFATDSST